MQVSSDHYLQSSFSASLGHSHAETELPASCGGAISEFLRMVETCGSFKPGLSSARQNLLRDQGQKKGLNWGGSSGKSMEREVKQIQSHCRRVCLLEKLVFVHAVFDAETTTLVEAFPPTLTTTPSHVLTRLPHPTTRCHVS